MSKIALKWAELHAPLFLAGTNLAQKLDPTKRTGLELTYDRSEKELIVTWNGATAIIPSSSVLSMTPDDAAAEPMTARQIVAAQVKEIQRGHPPSGPIVAQVDSPIAHVHAGPGKGKT